MNLAFAFCNWVLLRNRKVTGTWRVWKRNTHLIEQTSTVRCIEVEIEHDENSGDIFKMLVKWIDPK